MTYQEANDRLTRVQDALQSLQDGSYANQTSINVPQMTSQLQEVEVKLQEQLLVLSEAEKTAFVNGQPTEYTDEKELQKFKDNQDVKSIKTAAGKKIKEAAGVQFTLDETKAIAREIGKAVAKGLKASGDELASMKAKNIEEGSFDIHVQYKKDTRTDDFSFHISGDDLHLTDFSFDKIVGSVGVKPSGDPIVHVDVIANELVKHWKSQMKEGMSDDEWSDAKEKDRLEQHPEKDMIKKIQALITKQRNDKQQVKELETRPISGTKSGWVSSLSNRKYILTSDVTNAQIGDYVSVVLPKGTTIYNLPGGVFADHESLKDRFRDKWVKQSWGQGVSIRRMPDTLQAIEDNSKVLGEQEEDGENTEPHFIEVSVRTARKALDILHDMFRGQYETDGSNYYVFADEQDGYDAGLEMASQGIELEDTNIEGLEEAAVFDGDDEAAEIDFITRRRETNDYNEQLVKETCKVGDILTKDGKKGKVVKVMDDMVNVDFGNGDVYGIVKSRIKNGNILKEEEEMNEAPYQTTYIKVARRDYKKAIAVLDGNIDPTYIKMDIVDDDGDGNVIIYFNFRDKDAGEFEEDVPAFIYDVAQDLRANDIPVSQASHDIEESLNEAPYQTTYIKVAKSDYKKAMAILDPNLDPTYVKTDIVDDDGDGNVIIYFNFRSSDDGEPDEDVGAFIYDVAMDLRANDIPVSQASHDIEEAIDINDPVLMKLRALKTQRSSKTTNPNWEKEKGISPKVKAIIDKLKAKRAQVMRDMEQEAEPEGGPIADKYGDILNKIDTALEKAKGQKQISYDDAIGEGEDNEKSIQGQELVDYIMNHWNWSEEKTLHWLANNFGKAKKQEGPKEEDQRYIDYLRRSGRDEYADKLVAINPDSLKEDGTINEYGSTDISDLIGAIGYRHLEQFFEDNPGAVEEVNEWVRSVPQFLEKIEDEFGDEYSSSMDTLINAIGYDDFDEFFDDNPGAVEALSDWIISIPEFVKKLQQEYSTDELENFGIYDVPGYDAEDVELESALKEDKADAARWFSNLKFSYQKGLTSPDLRDPADKTEYKRLVKDFFSKLEVDHKVRPIDEDSNSPTHTKVIKGEPHYWDDELKQWKPESYKFIKSSFKAEGNGSGFPKEHPSRHGDIIFRLVKEKDGRGSYEVLDAEDNNKVIGRMAFGSPDKLKAFALDYIKPQGGRQSTNLGEGKSAKELKVHIAALSKARAAAASSGKTTLLNSLHKDISKAQKELKKLSLDEAAYDSATRNELAQYIINLNNELKAAKSRGMDKEAEQLQKDIEEVKAALARKKEINEEKATCCGKCGRVHVKGTKCKTPYLKGKDHCRYN